MFYVEPCGTKGLVAAIEDQSSGVKWRGGSTNHNTMARGSNGKENTLKIIAVHSARGDSDDNAALVCTAYMSGFGDWHLPSSFELGQMYSNGSN